eukprot:COSAG02_NODE_68924_length_212_cov_20.858407_1_plen_34_part_10
MYTLVDCGRHNQFFDLSVIGLVLRNKHGFTVLAR